MTNVIINVLPNSYFRGTKVFDGVTYTLVFRWNTTTEKWYMDIDGGEVSIKGIALMTGKDLLARYGYRQLGQLWVIDNSDADENPDFEGFGSRFTLEYVPLA